MKISTSSIVDRKEVLADLLRDLETINLAKKVKVGSLLYERVSSSVYRGVLRDRIDTSGSERIKRVIIKRFRVPIIDQDQIIKRISRELRVWANLEHQNILPLLGFIMQDNGDSVMFPSLVSEHMERGTLRDELKRNPDLNVFDMVNGIANGLSYLHAKNIVHGDLKSSNILISRGGDPKLMDFGISHMLSTTMQYAETATSGEAGSILWMAPELLNPEDTHNHIHTSASDIWAFGMVVLEILTKELPFGDNNKKKRAQMIIVIMKGELPTISPEYTRLLGTDYLWDLCSKSLCLNRLPDLRPSIRAIQVYLFTNCPELSRNNLESFADMTHTTEGHNVYPQLISPTSDHFSVSFNSSNSHLEEYTEVLEANPSGLILRAKDTQFSFLSFKGILFSTFMVINPSSPKITNFSYLLDTDQGRLMLHMTGSQLNFSSSRGTLFSTLIAANSTSTQITDLCYIHNDEHEKLTLRLEGPQLTFLSSEGTLFSTLGPTNLSTQTTDLCYIHNNNYEELTLHMTNLQLNFSSSEGTLFSTLIAKESFTQVTDFCYKHSNEHEELTLNLVGPKLASASSRKTAFTIINPSARITKLRFTHDAKNERLITYAPPPISLYPTIRNEGDLNIDTYNTVVGRSSGGPNSQT